jgi:hypothetical protein
MAAIGLASIYSSDPFFPLFGDAVFLSFIAPQTTALHSFSSAEESISWYKYTGNLFPWFPLGFSVTTQVSLAPGSYSSDGLACIGGLILHPEEDKVPLPTVTIKEPTLVGEIAGVSLYHALTGNIDLAQTVFQAAIKAATMCEYPSVGSINTKHKAKVTPYGF